MDVCELADHRATYLDIWVRQVIIIIIIWLLLCFLLHLHVMISVPYFRYGFHMICNSDSIRLGIRWHEIKVYRWGFPCLDYSFDVLFSWDRDLSVYNHSCLYQLYSGFPVLWCLCYTRSFILPLCSNPPVFWVWHLCSSCFATWHCIARGVSDTPQASMIQCQVAKQGEHKCQTQKTGGLEHNEVYKNGYNISIINQEIQGKADYVQDWFYTLKSRSHENSTSKE